MPHPRITDLPRNDVKAALAYLEHGLDAGSFTSDDGQTLLMLQDDSDTLEQAVTAVIERRKKRGEPIAPFK